MKQTDPKKWLKLATNPKAPHIERTPHLMNFRTFYTLPKIRISKYHLNALELAICAYIEQYDSCLAIDSTGDTRAFSASDITPAQAREIAAFVDGWLCAKGF